MGGGQVGFGKPAGLWRGEKSAEGTLGLCREFLAVGRVVGKLKIACQSWGRGRKSTALGLECEVGLSQP